MSLLPFSPAARLTSAKGRAGHAAAPAAILPCYPKTPAMLSSRAAGLFRAAATVARYVTYVTLADP